MMLATVDPQEYAARRARLGIPQMRIIPRSAIEPDPAKHVVIEKKPRDWLYVTQIKPLTTSMRIQMERDIIQTTSFKYGVSVEEIMGEGRPVNVVRARHECFYRMSKEIGYSLPKIGKVMAGRDHTTIRNGIMKHKSRIGEIR